MFMHTRENKEKRDAVMICAKSLDFSYSHLENEKQLSDICLRVKEGEMIAILGKNGSGKSTLLRQLCCLFPVQAGELYVAGMDARQTKNARKIRRLCGMVFQNPDNQFVSSVVEEDIRFGLENYQTDSEKIEHRIKEVLKQVDMSGCETMSTHQLSGGQKQRIAIAGVMAVRPEILFLDEVTSMLDTPGKRDVWRIIERIRDAGHTILYVTQDVEEAVRADRILVMERGKILCEGSPEKVLTDYDGLIRMGLLPTFAGRIGQRLEAEGILLKQSLYDFEKSIDYLRQDERANAVFWHLCKKESGYLRQIYEGIRSEGSCEEKAKEDGMIDSKILRLENTTYSYQDGAGESSVQNAVSDVCVSVGRGEFVGVTGKTGCGKTTLLQILSGLIKPDEGTVFFDGENIHQKKFDPMAMRKALGVVFQFPEYQLFEKTVEEDVGFGLDNLGFDDREKAQSVQRALTQVGFDFEKIRKRIPATLSGGEKRRVALAGALAKQPEVLMLDEPIAGLDPGMREIFMGKLTDFCRQGGSVVVISHDLDCLMQYVSRIIYMNRGEIAFDGSIREYVRWQKNHPDVGERGKWQTLMEQLMRGR